MTEQFFDDKKANVKKAKADNAKADKSKANKAKADNAKTGSTAADITCPYVGKCGGCRTIGTDYRKTLNEKKKNVKKLLKGLAEINEIVGMDEPYHYRNKVTRTFAAVRDGRRIRHEAGIYREGTHKIVPVADCLIEDAEANAIMRDILQIARKYKMSFYNEQTGDGLLRHVLIRTAHKTGQIMVVLVLTSPIMTGKNNFVALLRKKHPRIATVVINVNDEDTSMVLGEKESVAFGKGQIEDELCGKRFRISSRSFYQINPVQTEKLYETAIEYAELTGSETVVDAYCGIGTIGICCADHAAQVIAAELNSDAVRDAAANARRNNVKNIRFVNKDAGKMLSGMAAEGKRADVIIMDPPRTGSSPEFLAAAVAIAPKRIVYISCGPDTLARDLEILAKSGYKAEKAKAFDMFPFTDHCEVIVSLTRTDQ